MVISNSGGNNYSVSGNIAVGEGNLGALGFEPPVTHPYSIKITVNGAAAGASITVQGDREAKTVEKDNFDGADYAIFVLDGATKTYTITAKSATDAETVSLTLSNSATLDPIPTKTSVEKYEGELTLNEQPYTFANPELIVTPDSTGYKLTGTIAKYAGDLSGAGFGPEASNVYALKLTVTDAEESAIVKVQPQDGELKTYAKENFNGADFIYLAFDGAVSKYTITAQAAATKAEATVVITNEASLGE